MDSRPIDGKQLLSVSKGLVLAHLNVCSIRNKVFELNYLTTENTIHILAVSETHLDATVLDKEISIDGYNIFRRDRNKHGGGIALYIRDNFPAVLCSEFISDGLESLWVKVHLPHLKPVLIGCCYRPPGTDVQYLNDLCVLIDRVTDVNSDIFLLGDMNIDWFANQCPMKQKLVSLIAACNLSQMISQPTRVFTNSAGHTSCHLHRPYLYEYS